MPIEHGKIKESMPEPKTHIQQLGANLIQFGQKMSFSSVSIVHHVATENNFIYLFIYFFWD